jgi:putative transposase
VKKSRFTEAQIVAILKELDAGTAATELARRHGIHANTIRQGRDKYAGLETSDLTRLRQLEAESARKDRVIVCTPPPSVNQRAPSGPFVISQGSLVHDGSRSPESRIR